MSTSKQDRHGARTASDIEYRYNFGKSFAEVYNLVRDVQTAVEDAAKAIEGLDSEEIFNRLTNYGEVQGIYRDANGEIYVNASYIQSGTLAAEYIDADNLKVKAANVTGTLTASQINTTGLKVDAANIKGTLVIGQLPSDVATTGTISSAVDSAVAGKGYVNSTQVTTITNNAISTAQFSAAQITSGTLSADRIDVDNLYVDAANIEGVLSADYIRMDGLIEVESDGQTYGYIGGNGAYGVTMLDSSEQVGVSVQWGHAEMFFAGEEDYHCIWVNMGGCYADGELLTSSDRRLKNSISYDLADAEKMFMELKPCSFAYNKDKKSKTHWGFIAQDFIEAATAAGMNSGTLAALGCSDGMYALSYGSFAALNTHMIQKIIKALEANGITLEG